MAASIDWGTARLSATRDLVHDVRLFEIEPLTGFVAPTPGSHIRLMVEINGRPDIRHYSTVGPCRDGRYRIAVKRLADSRGGSAYMWSLSEGARLTIAPPANHFALRYGRPEYLLLAGGIGITPIYSMALALAEAQAPFRLLYTCRRADDLALAEELRGQIGDRLQIFLDERGEGRCRRGNRPPAFTRRALRVRADGASRGDEGGVARTRPCGRSPALRDLRKQRPLSSESFSVRLPQLGRTIEVPANQTMLSALEAAGIDVISDCRRGECGLCAVTILEVAGIVDHRDVFFSEAEHQAGEKLCTCVSRVVGGSVTIDTGDRQIRHQRRAEGKATP